MTGPWQQFHPHHAGYQQPGNYGYPHAGYPQAGYPPSQFQPQGGYPPYGGQPVAPYGHAQAPMQYPHGHYQGPVYPQAGPYPSPHAMPYPQPPPHPPAPHPPTPQNNCYNCGALEHWAQDCPEPRRAVPYGQLVQQNRPGKRLRPNYKPPVVTKYAVPPHVTQTQPTPPYNGTPSWNASPPYPTPNPAVSSPPVAWPGPSPQQQQLNSTRYPHATTPESLPGQTPGPRQRRPSDLHRDVLTPPYGPDQSEPAAPPSNGTASVEPTKAGSRACSAPMTRGNSRASHISTDQSVSMASESEAEGDEEDLTLLDIPDLPNLNCYAGAKQPQPVAAPLLAFHDDDEAGKLARPEEGTATVHSRYHGGDALDTSDINVRDRAEFVALQDDPLFIRIRPETPPREATPPQPTQAPVETERERPAAAGPSTPGPSTPDPPPEQSNGVQAKEFDPFDPATGDLEHLVRKHCPDAAPRKSYGSNAAPPPPPPPPPEGPPYGARAQYSPDASRRRSNHAMHSPEGGSGWSPSSASPTTERSSRKRKYDDESRRAGERQRDSPGTKSRRNAPRVADVYSRRW